VDVGVSVHLGKPIQNTLTVAQYCVNHIANFGAIVVPTVTEDHQHGPGNERIVDRLLRFGVLNCGRKIEAKRRRPHEHQVFLVHLKSVLKKTDGIIKRLAKKMILSNFAVEIMGNRVDVMG